MQYNSKLKRFIIVIGTLILVIIFLKLFVKYYNIIGIGIPCLFHSITGLYCPGCGITRAIINILNGDLLSALHNNLLLFIVWPYVIYIFIKSTINWIINAKFTAKSNRTIWLILLIITILYGILRNISIFDFLRPII